jgi:hypothetical protein
MHILNVHTSFVLPLVTPGSMPRVPFVRAAVQSLILASSPPAMVKPINVSSSGWAVSNSSNTTSLILHGLPGVWYEHSRFKISRLLHGFMLLGMLAVVRRTFCCLCCFKRYVHCRISRGVNINSCSWINALRRAELLLALTYAFLKSVRLSEMFWAPWLCLFQSGNCLYLFPC